LGEHVGEGNRTPAPRTKDDAITIYDIARLTGYSPSTVSRGLHKPGRLSVATEAKIREAAKTLGYNLNPSARALLTGKTGNLGLVVSDLTNPAFFGLIRAAEAEASSQGRTLILSQTGGEAGHELEIANHLLPSVDGLVLVASRLDDDDVVRIARRKPVVLANRSVDGVASVIPDGSPGVREALDHLAALGHRSLAFLAGPSESWISRARWEVLLDESMSRGLSIVEIGPCEPSTTGGRNALRRVLAAGVTAVHAYNDLVAIGLLQACQDEGIAVPDRLSIIGNDDILGSEFTTPRLTTIRVPMTEIGRDSVRRLLAGAAATDPSQQRLPTSLVVRGSTGPAPS
jgi:LacI family transcriptional regulator